MKAWRLWLTRFDKWVVFLLFLCLIAWLAWPVLSAGEHVIPGKDRDVLVHLWAFEHVLHALTNGGPLFYSSQIYFPEGADLRYLNFAWLHILLWLPLQAFLGTSLAFKIVFFLGFLFNGYATYLFAQKMLPSRIAAFGAAMVVFIWPYTHSHHDHPNIVLMGTVSLVLWGVVRLFEDQTLGRAIQLGLLIALAGIGRWQMLLFAFPLVVLFTIWYGWKMDKPVSLTLAARQLAIANGLAILFMLPALAPLLSGGDVEQSAIMSGVVLEEQNGSDLLGYLIPSSFSYWWGSRVTGINGAIGSSRFFTPFLGYSVLLLMGIGMAFNHRRRWGFWVALFLLYLLFALGNRLFWNGTPTIPLPFRWIDGTVVGLIIRNPYRLNLILAIPAALLVGWGIAAIQSRTQKGWGNLIAFAIVGLIFIELMPVYHTLTVGYHPFHAQLRAENEAFAIAEIPIDRDSSKNHLYYQSLHQKPIVDGHLSRTPAGVEAFVKEHRLLEHFDDLPDANWRFEIGSELESLSAAGVKYLLINKSRFTPQTITYFQETVLVSPFFEDETMLVYQTDIKTALLQMEGRGLDETGQFTLLDLALTDQITKGQVCSWKEHSPLLSRLWGRLISVSDCWLMADPLGCTSIESIESSLTEDHFEAGQLIQFHTQFQIDPFFPSGNYDLQLLIQTDAADSWMSVGDVTIDPLPRAFTSPSSGNEPFATWHESLSLVAYDVVIENPDSIGIELRWQALERLPYYKMFIHVIDIESGMIEAQADFVPKNWAYPTNWWEAGEFVDDRIDLPRAGISGGEKKVYVGMVNPDSGERISLNSQEPGRIENGAFLLEEVNFD